MADGDRKARLAALRAAAAAEGEGDGQPTAAEQQQQEQSEPVLKFRNYAPTAEDRIQHEKVRRLQKTTTNGRACATSGWPAQRH